MSSESDSEREGDLLTFEQGKIVLEELIEEAADTDQQYFEDLKAAFEQLGIQKS